MHLSHKEVKTHSEVFREDVLEDSRDGKVICSEVAHHER
jgi:hypothetical protein